MPKEIISIDNNHYHLLVMYLRTEAERVTETSYVSYYPRECPKKLFLLIATTFT